MKTNSVNLFDQNKEVILDVIHNCSKNCENEIDKQFKQEIEDIVYLLTKIFVLLSLYSFSEKRTSSDEHLFPLLIFWQMNNNLLACLQLIRQGYFIESQSMMKIAIENYSLGITIALDKKKLQLYKDEKLGGQNCVTKTKETTPEIGQFYGIINEVVHPTFKVLAENAQKGGKTLNIGGSFMGDNPKKTTLNLTLLTLLLMIFWEGIELVFYYFIDESDRNFWVKTNDAQYKKVMKDEVVINLKSKMKINLISSFNFANNEL